MSFPLIIGNPFLQLQQVESTNNYATGLVHAGMAQSGTAVFAHYQTEGKGQRNKSWQGDAGKNIALSIILCPPPLPFTQAHLLSQATAVGVHQFFLQYAGDETKIKWPNDIYWRDRKAGGILIENMVQGSNWKAAVIGIGLNINQTAFGMVEKKAVSLKQITGQDFQPVELAKQLCTFLQKAYEEAQHSSAKIKEAYLTNLFMLNHTVRLKQGSRVFNAIIKGVSQTGDLIVEHAVEEHFGVGEIEWLI